MAMLIKGGFIYTMTEQGCFQGDILIRKGRIAAVAEHIVLPEGESVCMLDAEGMSVLPGLLDIHIHDNQEIGAPLLQDSASSGVTGGLLWAEEEGLCSLLLGDEQAKSDIYVLQPAKYSSNMLQECLLSLTQSGYRIACEVHNPAVCERILEASRQAGVPLILVHLSGCKDMLEEIARSGCAAVVGVNHNRSGNPWQMACRLRECGVPVALTCNYPDAKLRHLPLCAALCVREGMNRGIALQTITTAPAALSGLSDVGMIKVDARADLAIYDGDPLLLATSHVMTIVGGRIRH